MADGFEFAFILFYFIIFMIEKSGGFFFFFGRNLGLVMLIYLFIYD